MFVSWKQGDSGFQRATIKVDSRLNQPVLAVSTSLELTNHVFFFICTKKREKKEPNIGVQFKRLLIVYMCAMINNNNMSFYKLLEDLGSVSFGWRQPVVPLFASLHAKLTVHCRRGLIFTTQTQRWARYSHGGVCKETGKLTRLSNVFCPFLIGFGGALDLHFNRGGFRTPSRTGTGSPSASSQWLRLDFLIFPGCWVQ